MNGIYSDNTPELRTSYPVNLVPVPKVSGISNGFLRPGDGIVSNGTGPGIDRGGINWQNVLYRVMGTKLVEISSAGAVTVLGDVGGPVTELVTFDYSFDVLAIASGGRLYYWIPVYQYAQNILTCANYSKLAILGQDHCSVKAKKSRSESK